MNTNQEHQIISHIRSYFITGLFLILPLAATIWVILFTVKLIGYPVGNFLKSITDSHISGGFETALGFIITFCLIAGIGYLAQNIVGRSVLRYVEEFILKVPIANTIYNTAKQIIESITMQNKKAFRSVGMIEYPRKGIYALGFITNEETKGVLYEGLDLGKGMVSIFLPTTPNPTSGYFIMVPRGDVKILDITVEEAIKLIISGGVLSPREIMESK